MKSNAGPQVVAREWLPRSIELNEYILCVILHNLLKVLADDSCHRTSVILGYILTLDILLELIIEIVGNELLDVVERERSVHLVFLLVALLDHEAIGLTLEIVSSDGMLPLGTDNNREQRVSKAEPKYGSQAQRVRRREQITCREWPPTIVRYTRERPCAIGWHSSHTASG